MTFVRLRQVVFWDNLLCSLLLPGLLAVSSALSQAVLLAVFSATVQWCNYSNSGNVLMPAASGAYVAATLLSVSPGGSARLCCMSLLVATLWRWTLQLPGCGHWSGGELQLFTQSVCLFCSCCLFGLPQLVVFGVPIEVGPAAAIASILQTSFVLLLVWTGLLFVCPSVRHSAVRMYIWLCTLALSVVAVSSIVINQNAVLWTLHYLLGDNNRVWLLCVWSAWFCVAVCVAAGCAALSSTHLRRRTSRSVSRKTFHLLLCAVFVPGLYWDPLLLLAASAGLTLLFVLTEVLRVCRVSPVFEMVQTCFDPFLDSKDQGPLILSNMYLLVGCSGVLWYTGTKAVHPGPVDPALMSGVISVGIGDTTAAVVGSVCGRLYWPGSQRTMEGSVAMFSSQVLAVYWLIHTGYMQLGRLGWTSLICAISATTCLEAVTHQPDNLTLPLLFSAVYRIAETSLIV